MLVLSILGHVSRPSCKFALRILQVLVENSFQKEEGLTEQEKHIIKTFPTDIRSVRKAFALEAKCTTYASCLKCCCIYAPKNNHGIPVYPAICINQRHLNSKPCGTRITSVYVIGGKSMRVPARSFAVQCFDTFVEGLLSQPGIEDAIEQMSKLTYKDILVDIGDGDIIRDM